MTAIRDIIKKRKEYEKRFATEQVVTTGVIVARNGSTRVPGVKDHIWVMTLGVGEPVAVFNRQVKGSRAGLGVQIGFAPYSSILEVLRSIIDTTAGVEDNAGVDMVAHAQSHLIGGDDPLYVYDNAIMILLTYSLGLDGLLVNVSPYIYESGGEIVVFSGKTNYSLAAHQPAAGLARYVLVYLDIATNMIMSVAGDTVVDSPAYTPTPPAVPSNSSPSALVRITGGSSVVAPGDITGVRDFLFGGSRVQQLEQQTLDLLAALENEWDLALTLHAVSGL